MKKFQKLLAILLTAVMCAGTFADTGITVFAEDDVDDAEEYDLWLGNTQVTSTNKGDILGDGKASFDPDTWTLTLNGRMSIPGNHAVAGLGAALTYSKHALNLEGSASFDTEYNAIVIDSGYPLDESIISGDFLYAQSKGKCKLTTKINGKTITINVTVD